MAQTNHLTPNQQRAHKLFWLSWSLFKSATTLVVALPALALLLGLASLVLLPFLVLGAPFALVAEIKKEGKDAWRTLVVAALMAVALYAFSLKTLFVGFVATLALAAYSLFFAELFAQERTQILRVWHGKGGDRSAWAEQQHERDLRTLVRYHEALVSFSLSLPHEGVPYPQRPAFEDPITLLDGNNVNEDDPDFIPHLLLAQFLHARDRDDEAHAVLERGTFWVNNKHRERLLVFEKTKQHPHPEAVRDELQRLKDDHTANQSEERNLHTFIKQRDPANHNATFSKVRNHLSASMKTHQAILKKLPHVSRDFEQSVSSNQRDRDGLQHKHAICLHKIQEVASLLPAHQDHNRLPNAQNHRPSMASDV